MYFIIIIIVLCLLFTTGVVWWIGRQAEERLQLVQQNAFISALMDIEEIALLVDERGIVEFINPPAEKLLRMRVRNARGKSHREVLQILDSTKRIPINWMSQGAHKKSVSQTYFPCLVNTKELQELQTSYFVRLLPKEGKENGFTLLLLRDQSEVRALQMRLDYLEMHDQRTGLLNRKCFELHLKIALDEARQQDIKHSFVHIALDQFKMINDTVGHNAGDAFIERLSRVLKEAIDQKKDILARIGGDEFGILLREIEPAQALRMAEQIRAQIESLDFTWNTRQHKITASIGFVPLFKRSGHPNRVLSVADAACRVAKTKGGNRLHIYRPDDEEVKKHRGQLIWLGRLRKAFELEQFRLVAQPIHPLDPKQFDLPFSHYEVLIRLFDENGHPISPDEFIPAAEYYSLMPRMDRWVVRTLLQAVQRINQRDPLPMFSINLSGQSIDDENFLSYVQDEIRKASIDPRMLCFEITERVAISNVAIAKKFIETLKKQGCSFSLDDFGTGVSSFGYLKSLPVNYLKIDGSFIKDIANDGITLAMVQSINQVGQMMMVQTIAEFVENDRIIEVLRDIGVDHGQGYGISKPVPLDDVIATHII